MREGEKGVKGAMKTGYDSPQLPGFSYALYASTSVLIIVWLLSLHSHFLKKKTPVPLDWSLP